MYKTLQMLKKPAGLLKNKRPVSIQMQASLTKYKLNEQYKHKDIFLI